MPGGGLGGEGGEGGGGVGGGGEGGGGDGGGLGGGGEGGGGKGGGGLEGGMVMERGWLLVTRSSGLLITSDHSAGIPAVCNAALSALSVRFVKYKARAAASKLDEAAGS